MERRTAPRRFVGSLLLWVLAPAALAQSSSAPPQSAPYHGPHADRRDVARFAVIGDYGFAGTPAAEVALWVGFLDVDFVITVGDNNYNDGAASTIDANIGQYYHAYIHPYVGIYGPGAAENRFFPALGNHDWNTVGAAPYLSYFTLPNNERYYDFVRGPVHFFALDMDPHEPDGVLPGSTQGLWLQTKLAAATEPFKIVYHHFPPYSSGTEHGDTWYAQWPYQLWGASAVVTGHEHDYERLTVGGFPYFVNGLGGKSLYAFAPPVAGSDLRFNADYGAMLVEATRKVATFQFVTRAGIVVDTDAVTTDPKWFQETTLVPRSGIWKYWDQGASPGSGWTQTVFNDGAWASGPAPLGYGDGDEATVVSFGPNPNNKYVTTWFRKAFLVVNPGAYSQVRLRLQRDDGAVAYLNGVEVFRTNMPGGTVTSGTLASSSIADSQESSLYEAVLPPSVLVPGTNLLAVEIHQAAVTSSDVSFDAELVGWSGDTVLLPRGSVWKYWDQAASPGAAWAQPNYLDAAWPAGPAQLGYGDGDEATVLSFGPNPNQKRITSYFRRTFNVSSAAAVKTLLLRLLRDDGAIVYLNGREVHRTNLPYGAVLPTTLAGFAVGGADESTFFESRIDPQWLVDGANVLAVELHQSSPTSSDVSFDLELVAF